MANQKPARMDEVIDKLAMQMLLERVSNPMRLVWDWEYEQDTPEKTATDLLFNAGYLHGQGAITLAGIDYYRQKTKRFRWMRDNWFPVFVAVLTAGATLGAGILTIWFGNRPC